jgi:CysZ protein
MFGDIARAIGEFRRPTFWGVAALSVALTLALLGVVFALAGWALGVGGDLTAQLPVIGDLTAPGSVGTVLYVLAALAASVLLMGPVAALFVGLFLEVVVGAVERRSYPDAPPGRGAGLWDQLRSGLGLFGALILGNIAVLILSLFMPPLAPFLLIGMNGWLIGREYAEMVAMRRMTGPEAKAFRKRHSGRIFAFGVATAALLAVPVVNLFAPLVGAAAATHCFHRAERNRA